MKKIRNVTVLVFLFLILFPLPVMAASLVVTWNANTEDDLKGYKVYYGQASRDYTSSIDVGNVTNYKIDGLSGGNTYFVSVTAYDNSGNESSYSEEVSASIPLADTTPPQGSITINSGVERTSSRTVTLGLSASDPSGVITMKLSNDGTTWSDAMAYSSSKTWELSAGDGVKSVYALFEDAAGNWMTTPVSASIELLLDTDNDGMPDSWELSKGLNPNDASDASEDMDNDGVPNLQEYTAGTDPNDASDNVPVANAGPDIETVPTRVYLDGSSSTDPNGDSLTYTWSQVSGPVDVNLENATGSKADFVATKAGRYVFMLTCSDGKASVNDTVSVTIQNVPPVVDAGDDMTVSTDQEVVLHATGNDPNGDELTYQWSKVEGPDVSLPSLNTQDIRVTFHNSGQYIFSVTSSDGENTSSPDKVIVNVNSINHAPTANAGQDRDVSIDDKVVLDGSNSSDPDGDVMTYSWEQVSGPAVELHDANAARPWFDACEEGTLTFQLTVSDQEVASIPDTVQIRVVNGNHAPVADAGSDLNATVGDTVVLDGSGSYDPDGDGISYAWTQESGGSVELIHADTVEPSFTPTGSGVYTFRLEVSDAHVQAYDTVTVTVSDKNNVPLADAGEDLVAATGDVVKLDGSSSYDPDGDEISYIWTQVDGPRVTMDNPNSVSPSFTPWQSGVYVFGLKVYDGKDTSKMDTVNVTVEDTLPDIILKTPSMGSVVFYNPEFSWSDEGMETYSLYISLNNGYFYKIYSGHDQSFSMHPVLWYWFVPSGTTISWYVIGESEGQEVKSGVYSFKKR